LGTDVARTAASWQGSRELGRVDRALELSPEEHQRLEAVSRPPLIYPFWHQFASAGERLGEADLSLIGPHLSD